MHVTDANVHPVRTTVTIDDDLLAEVKVLAARERRTLSDVVQDALRVALTSARPRRTRVDFPTSGDPDIPPLVDILDKEALAEVMGDNEWPRRNDADR